MNSKKSNTREEFLINFFNRSITDFYEKYKNELDIDNIEIFLENVLEITIY